MPKRSTLGLTKRVVGRFGPDGKDAIFRDRLSMMRPSMPAALNRACRAGGIRTSR